MNTAISVRNVAKTYLSYVMAVPALRSISLDVEYGEVVMLVNPSGSGKTTLLSILGCILHPSSGSVRVRERDVTGLSEQELSRIRLDQIGFVFQACNLFPALTAAENVELALDLKGVGRKAAKRRAEELIERVALSDKCHSFPADLSLGQKQRIAIARALAGDPDIILADEPTASLDSRSGRVVIELLRDLATQHGRAVVVVTHDVRALEFADRIAHMEDGQIVQHTAPGVAGTTVRTLV